MSNMDVCAVQSINFFYVNIWLNIIPAAASHPVRLAGADGCGTILAFFMLPPGR